MSKNTKFNLITIFSFMAGAYFLSGIISGTFDYRLMPIDVKGAIFGVLTFIALVTMAFNYKIDE